MKILIGFLFIGIFLSVYLGFFQPSIATLSSVDSTTLVGVIESMINFCEKTIELLSTYYHDFKASSKTVYFLKSYLPLDQMPGTFVLLGCGFIGLWGYGRKRVKK